MSEFREVYDMVTKQGPSVRDPLERQRDRQRRSARTRKVGTIAFSAGLAIAAVLLVVLIGRGAIDRGTDRNTPARPTVLPSGSGAYLFDLDAAQPTHVAGIQTQGIESPGIAVSPDGTMIAYRGADRDGTSVLYVANVDGTDIRPLGQTAHAGVGPIGPAFSPDGSQIVYQAKGFNTLVGDIFVVDVASGETTRVTRIEPVYSTLWYMGPHFSPDGETVYYTLPGGDFAKTWDLMAVPLSGGTPRIVIRGAIGGRLSPDGRTIVYFEYTPARSIGGEMWLADADGSDARRVPKVSGDVFSARWSPDGTRIAFTDQEENSAYVVDVATGEVTRVLDEITKRIPEWVDDHTWIVGSN
jgi:Tol biopolymer transport system component